jgi:hypothetical protein
VQYLVAFLGNSRIGFNSHVPSMRIYELEKDVQAAITQYLTLMGIFHWKQNNTGIKKDNGSWIPSNLPGVSDILGILKDGRFLAIEVKRPGGKATEAQLEFIENINDNGGVAFVADNVDIVIERLENC